MDTMFCVASCCVTRDYSLLCKSAITAGMMVRAFAGSTILTSRDTPINAAFFAICRAGRHDCGTPPCFDSASLNVNFPSTSGTAQYVSANDALSFIRCIVLTHILAPLHEVRRPPSPRCCSSANRYDYQSTLPASTLGVRDLGARIVSDGAKAEDTRESKLRLLVSAESAELARDAVTEACVLAPGSMYLGGLARARLTAHFRDIARQLELGGRHLSFPGLGGNNNNVRNVRVGAVGGGCRSKEFDAYKEILDAAEECSEAGGREWSREEVERLERMRRVVQPAAARVVGAAVAHEALNTVWTEAAIAVR